MMEQIVAENRLGMPNAAKRGRRFMKTFLQKNWAGLLLCLAITIPAWFLGKLVPVVGGPVFAILAGMLLTLLLKQKDQIQPGITFTSKKILQAAVVLLGFGMNLTDILQKGKQSLPIILATISTSLLISFLLCKMMKVPTKTATLVGVGSSICGGSAIAATAPVIDADDEEIAQSISVIFLFNVIAALIFPTLGGLLGLSNEGFGLFAGTAINDTSSVTAAAQAWDGIHGSNTLDAAAIVKLTRTLAIIPITLVLAFVRTRRERHSAEGAKVNLKKIFPFFVLIFFACFRGYHRFPPSGRGDKPFERDEQILYCHGNGGNRPEHQHHQACENRRKTDLYGALLLDWYRGSEPADATFAWHLVKAFS